ncbi:MAG: hypothetical protein HY369_00475 [Candidatus Aenigmarchaeota archaeon]|nr:hypothetical protein [Candidatus Aenigmarchaeota archaeon]
MSTKQFYVEIVRDKDRHIEKRMGPMSERSAERTQRGASINLNHDAYSVRIVPAEDATEGGQKP